MPYLLDGALAAVLLLGAGVTVTSSRPEPRSPAPIVSPSSVTPGEIPSPLPGGQSVEPDDSHPLALLLLAPFQTVPLAFRRKWPLLVLAVVVVSSAIAISIGVAGVAPFVLVVALYSVAAHTDRRIATRAGLATLAVVGLPLVLAQHVGPLEAVSSSGSWSSAGCSARISASCGGGLHGFAGSRRTRCAARWRRNRPASPANCTT